MTRIKVVGQDPVFRPILSLVDKVAPGRSPVVIVGPTGSGKSHLARLIHERGAHPAAPFVEWHAGAVPESLLEVELLGVHRGAATGVNQRPGLFEAAGRGTLCLSGIEILASHQQAILLRILENRTFERVGGGGAVRASARILSTFLEPPESLVDKGKLRADLFYRLDVIRLDVPALSHRPLDIPLLAEHFLKSASRQIRRKPPKISPSLMKALCDHPWPGNLRELAQRMEGLALTGGETLVPEDLPPGFWLDSFPVEDAFKRRLTIAELRDAYIRHVLSRLGGNRTQAARWLGISRKALWDHLRRGKVEV